jgi:hypothetical protein
MRETLISSLLGDDAVEVELAVVWRASPSRGSCFSIALEGISTSSAAGPDGHLSGLASRSSACMRRSSSFMLKDALPLFRA